MTEPLTASGSQRLGSALLCAALLSLCSACQPEPPNVAAADIVFRSGYVYTGLGDSAERKAVAVRDESIVFVGSDADAESYVGAETLVVELADRLLMPGIVDAHLHPIQGALKNLYQCNFPFSATPDDIQAAVASCIEAQPDAAWIRGGQWSSGFFERFDVPSPRGLLDAVSPNTAVYLVDDSGHNGWANTKALELAEVSAATPDPAGGSIGREADGTPNGLLIESAQGLVRNEIPDYDQTQYLDAANYFSNYANAFGITAVKAAAIRENDIRGFVDADRAGSLNLHVATSIRTPYGRRTEPLDYDEIDRIRDAYVTSNIDTRFVKIFLDGVPTPARTAAMLLPYVADDKYPANFDGGPLHVDKELLARDVTELERRGYTVKIHTAGDRSVRDALDAIEVARAANGATGLRHELSHAGYIHGDDLPRFAELGVVADLCPVIWHPSPIIDAVISAVGEERGPEYWPIRDLIDSGAPLLAGSDWPSAVPDANPWVGIEALVTRRDPRGEAPGALWPEQAIELKEAIDIYTIHGARALLLEDDIGTIEVGKLADLIVLDRNLFDIPIEQVGETEVELTFFRGKQSYQSPRLAN